jgi:glycerol-3-phosphate O-acyltransferase
VPPVVGAPLVAIVQAPAGVQQLVGQVQDLVIQHVAVQNEVPETLMEVEDEDSILQRLFFKKYGRALPEKEKENDVDNIKFVIDLTDEDEMEVATSEVVPAAVVKTEQIDSELNESAAAKVIADRKERRELVKARKALVAFGKTLRKSVQIPEKEAPEVTADTSVTTVNTESITTDEAIEMAEAAIAESDAAVNQKVMDEFDDESEFQLYRSEDDVIEDDDDDMIDNV